MPKLRVKQVDGLARNACRNSHFEWDPNCSSVVPRDTDDRRRLLTTHPSVAMFVDGLEALDRSDAYRERCLSTSQV